MVKTTVYLDKEIALTLRQLSSREGRSQAELIRAAIETYTRRQSRPAIPGVGEFDSGRTDVSRRAKQIVGRASVSKWRRTKSRGADR